MGTLHEVLLREQERLWGELEVKRLVDVDGLQVCRLPRWFYTGIMDNKRPDSELDGRFWERTRAQQAGHMKPMPASSPLEAHFNRMLSVEEWVKYARQPLPCGEEVYLDFRLDILCCVRHLAAETYLHLYESADGQKGVIMRPLDIRMSFLPHDNPQRFHKEVREWTTQGDREGQRGGTKPAKKYKAGCELPEGMKVVVLRDIDVRKRENAKMDKAVGKVGVVRFVLSSSSPFSGLKVELEGGEGVTQSVDVPKHRLAIVRTEDVKEKGGWFVLSGLRSRPELNGVCGFVEAEKGKGKESEEGKESDSSSERVAFMFRRLAPRGVTRAFIHSHLFSPNCKVFETISVKRENLVPVRDPTLLIVCAYVVTAQSDLEGNDPHQMLRLMQILCLSHRPLLKQQQKKRTPEGHYPFVGLDVECKVPAAKIKWTGPELERFIRFLEEGNEGIVQEEETQKEWMNELCVPPQGHPRVKFSVLTPVEAPEGRWRAVERDLRRWAVAYCSRECQKSDWKARHKQECQKKGEAGDQEGKEGRTAEQPAGAEGTEGVGKGNEESERAVSGERGTLSLPVVPEVPDYFQADQVHLNFTTGRIEPTGAKARVPSNIHGDSRFLVKLQRPVALAMMPSQMEVLDRRARMHVYDEARSLELYFYREKYRAEYRALEAVMLQRGSSIGPGMPNVRLYLWARRVGRALQLDLEDIPGEQRKEMVGW
uniref:MYND-type domain-containing protein n=1 Tax=Chromera velia CCMP2878 TaxID=1169474 RepID=A0A0G4FEH1_9ALVE|eukprot:Cvel_3234.t1-p1 / transcript=Cvel_3234.t1 / gene=Cvel_3234 / organism=Chromera_velia_CCMP2878 / gene_product=hypothetical protein / transcript_product=hypothetical protein / location=Cvel_scaffold126:125148-128349(-) / protein_length=709 / sequence_SO=supercontig / SO=protein_coding / is_pseudo=false